MALNIMESAEAEAFHARLRGTFSGILQWQQLDELWGKIKSGQWYFYQVGEALPAKPLGGEELAVRIEALNTLLHNDHDYHYCGIVYVDDVETPTLIKVYDPNNMGSSCSRSATPTPPCWILSTCQPVLIESHAPVPNNLKHRWRLFHRE